MCGLVQTFCYCLPHFSLLPSAFYVVPSQCLSVARISQCLPQLVFPASIRTSSFFLCFDLIQSWCQPDIVILPMWWWRMMSYSLQVRDFYFNQVFRASNFLAQIWALICGTFNHSVPSPCHPGQSQSPGLCTCYSRSFSHPVQLYACVSFHSSVCSVVSCSSRAQWKSIWTHSFPTVSRILLVLGTKGGPCSKEDCLLCAEIVLLPAFEGFQSNRRKQMVQTNINPPQNQRHINNSACHITAIAQLCVTPGQVPGPW